MKNPIAKAFKGKGKREKGKVKNPIAKAAQVIKHMDFSLFPFHFSLFSFPLKYAVFTVENA